MISEIPILVHRINIGISIYDFFISVLLRLQLNIGVPAEGQPVISLSSGDLSNKKEIFQSRVPLHIYLHTIYFVFPISIIASNIKTANSTSVVVP